MSNRISTPGVLVGISNYALSFYLYQTEAHQLLLFYIDNCRINIEPSFQYHFWGDVEVIVS